MHAVAAQHVVLVAGVDEEVGIGACVHTGFHERQGVLGHASVVVVVVDNHQVAFEVGSQILQVALLVAFGVGLRCIHVALAVHHLIVAPVDDGSACHAHLEEVRVTQHQGRGHVAAEAPSVYADAAAVYVGQRLEELDAFHLVLALLDAEVAEGAVLKLQAAVRTAAVVHGEEDVAFVGHVEVPAAGGVVPVVDNQLGMRAAIDIDNGGIFLRRVEVGRLDEAVVEIGLAVGRLEGTRFHAGHLETLERIGGGEQAYGFLAVGGGGDVDGARHVGSRPVVQQVRARGGELRVVYAQSVVYRSQLAVGDAYLIQIALQGRLLGGGDDDFLLLGVEAEDALHEPGSGGELYTCDSRGSLSLSSLLDSVPQFLCLFLREFLGLDGVEPFQVVQVEVVIAVTLALVDELVAIPGQEDDGLLRLHVLGVSFLDEHLHQLARRDVVLAELAVVLVAVQLDEEERLLVGCPCDVGEVAVGGVSRVQVDGLAVGRVIDAHLYLVARHAGHGVADVVHLTHACGDVYQRILGYHRLVHAVEGQQRAFRAPEGTFRDAELVAVNALSADDAFEFVGHLLVVHVEVVLQGVGHVSACHGIVRVGGFLVEGQDVGRFSGLPVISDVSAGQGDEKFRLVFPR